MTDEQESTILKEHERPIKNGWMFDADGVLFHTDSITIEKPVIADFIFQRLQRGEPVAINTGRTANFALDKILPALKERGVTNEMLEKFIVVGEKGAVFTYFQDGDMHVDIDKTISVPDYLREHIQDIIKEQFADTMFEGSDTKLSMFSPEKRGDVPLEIFKEVQPRFAAVCRDLIKQYGLDEEYVVDETKIAVDIQSKKVGKHFAAAKILDWMREKRLLPQQFHAFGDSASDIEMAEEIHNQGNPVEYVFVGDTNPYEHESYKGRKISFPMLITETHFDNGTSDFIKDFLIQEQEK